MVLHGAESPVDPLRALEEAARVARAKSHETKLERPIAEALAAQAAFNAALVDALRWIESILTRYAP